MSKSKPRTALTVGAMDGSIGGATDMKDSSGFPCTCAACGVEFRHRNRRRKYCSNTCKYDGWKGRTPANKVAKISYTCEQCGKVTTGLPSQSKRFCSLECYRDSKRGQPALNRHERVSKPCEFCGTLMELRPKLAAEQRFCNTACAHKARMLVRGEAHPLYKSVECCCKHCGESFKAKPSKVKLGEAIYCSRKCLGAAVSAMQGWRRSSIELAIEVELAKSGIEFEAQKQFRWYSVDFYIPSKGLVIECDGDYWHGTPKQKAKDRVKDTYLQKHGERVIRLTETEIKASPAAALARALAS